METVEILSAIKKQNITNERIKPFFHVVIVFSIVLSVCTFNPAIAAVPLMTDDLSCVVVCFKDFNSCEIMELKFSPFYVGLSMAFTLILSTCIDCTHDSTIEDFTQAGIGIEKKVENYWSQEEIVSKSGVCQGIGNKELYAESSETYSMMSMNNYV